MSGPRRGALRPVLLLLGLVLGIALYGVTAYPHSALAPSGGSLEAPSLEHLLGTDQLGIDVFAQLSRGALHSLLIGTAAATLALLIGAGLGFVAGFAGGRTDAGLSFVIHVFLAIPQLPAMIVVGAFWGQRTLNLILIIALFSWAPLATLVRDQTRSLRRRGYLQFARHYGGSPLYLFVTHMRAELLPLTLITGLAILGRAIVQEASIAYLGLADPTAKSLGLMINRASRFPGIYFTSYWTWWLVPPVLTLIALILGLRLIARGLERRWLGGL